MSRTVVVPLLLSLAACGLPANSDPCTGKYSSIQFTPPGGGQVSVPDQCIRNQQPDDFLFSLGTNHLIEFELRGPLEEGTRPCDGAIGNPNSWVTSDDNDARYESTGYTAFGGYGPGTCQLSVSSPYRSGLLTGSFTGHLGRKLAGSSNYDFLDISFDFNTTTTP
jgi:hypothetical protein